MTQFEPQDLVDVLSAQRNDALNLFALTKAELSAANRRIAGLEKELAEAKTVPPKVAKKK